MGAIHNDLFCWANKARAQGFDRIELHVDTALKLSEMLMDNAAKIDELKAEIAWFAARSTSHRLKMTPEPLLSLEQ